MTDSPDKMRNVGGKSAAWLRQVGIRTRSDLETHGAIGAFIKVKKAGFKPSLNLLYALAGALDDCHWQQLGSERREQLLAELAAQEEALGMTGKPKWGGPARPVTTIDGGDYQDGQGSDHDDDVTPDLRFD
ncbi:TfoX/Sxy family protein [Pseudofulvimonas gallinarii]|jgi:DNA transformation protein|uniref:TfoX-like protein n=1 Tax=Pseudofulvimonas gallinarii TaxID=634155 RepID=A0A4R3L1P8_9GAMM|nr:TfoX/Sxy family protein [Pseudofulvimonas gallinarii]TCS93511.1 TfoX-like protein [Pseudofulvimonas gallinarii]